MEEKPKFILHKKNTDNILKKKKGDNIIRINVNGVFINDSKEFKHNKNKDLNYSITESDSDSEKQNLNFLNMNYNNNKKKKRIKWSKEENQLFIEAFFKYKNNFKKIKKFINKPINHISSKTKQFLNRIKKLINDSQDENIIKLKIEKLFKKELKRKYDSSNLPDFILFLFENVLFIEKNLNKKDVNINIKNEKEELSTTATDIKSKELYKFLNENNKEKIQILIQTPKKKTFINKINNNHEINKSPLFENNDLENQNNKNYNNNFDINFNISNNIINDNYDNNIEEFIPQNEPFNLYDCLNHPSIIPNDNLQMFKYEDFNLSEENLF